MRSMFEVLRSTLLLNKTDQTDEMDEMDEMDEIDETDETDEIRCKVIFDIV